MRLSSRFNKWMSLVVVGSLFALPGAGSCLPQNFYSTLFGDVIVTGFVTKILQTLGLIP